MTECFQVPCTYHGTRLTVLLVKASFLYYLHLYLFSAFSTARRYPPSRIGSDIVYVCIKNSSISFSCFSKIYTKNKTLRPYFLFWFSEIVSHLTVQYFPYYLLQISKFRNFLSFTRPALYQTHPCFYHLTIFAKLHFRHLPLLLPESL